MSPEKAFDTVDWKKIMGILKKTAVYWKESRLLCNLYMKQCIKVRIGEEMSEGREIGKGYSKDVLYRLNMEVLMKNSFLNTEGEVEGVNIGGRRIKCTRFVDDMALLTGDERLLKNMLMELNGRCDDYGMKNIN